MKLGLSSYSLSRAIQSKEMDILQAIDWIKEHGGEHIEIVPFGFDLIETPELIGEIKQKVKENGMTISNYAIGANFLKGNLTDYQNEIDRVKKHVDITHELDVKNMRHDVAWRNISETSISNFEKDLPKLTEACQEIADYAAQYNIITNVENHGFYVQASDRVQRLIESVNRPNFKTVLDIGNFLCVDEDPLVSTKKNLPYASIIHLKDFYYRPGSRNPGRGWFKTAGGNHLRGAIVGHGDIDIEEILRVIKQSGYDGYISIEFEGLEDCKLGSEIGLENVKSMWDKINR